MDHTTIYSISLWLQHNGVDRLDDAAEWLKADRPQACPNLLLAQHFDNIIGAKGQLVRVCDEIGALSINRWWKLNHPS